MVEETEGPGENHRPVAIVVNPTTMRSRPRRPPPLGIISSARIGCSIINFVRTCNALKSSFFSIASVMDEFWISKVIQIADLF